jgi:hypothetical protein
MEVVRTTNEIREELDQAIARRAELWNRLAQGSDAETSAELAGLSKVIDELWSEYRTAEARKRFGSPELIHARARAEERLERDSRRVKQAA